MSIPVLLPLLAGLLSDLHGYMAVSLAPGTQSNLRTGLNHFKAFVNDHLQGPPIIQPRFDGDREAILHNELTFMLFAVYLVRDKQRLANTALNYCSLVRTHLEALCGFPLRGDSPRWRRLVRSLRKQHTRERKVCLPLRIVHLRCGTSRACHVRNFRQAVEEAAVATGVHLLARPGELGSLKRGQVSFVQTPTPHIVIRLMPLKKGPEQQPVPMLIAKGDGSGADAYAKIKRMLHLGPRNWKHNQPLFPDQYGNSPSVPTLTKWVQQVAAQAGETENLKLFTARSMRIGGATELHAVGANELTITLLGRWSSDCARLYTRASQGQVLALSSRMGRAAEDPSLEHLFGDFVQSARR